MVDTATPSDDLLHAFRALKPDFVADPAHTAWLGAECLVTLEAKAQGRVTYRPRDQIARTFGADAR